MPAGASGMQSSGWKATRRLSHASVVHYEQAFFIRQIIAASVPVVCLISGRFLPGPWLVPAFWVVVAATALNLLYYWLTVSGNFRTHFKWVQIALDMLLWTVLVHFTGGGQSIFFFLYPLEVLVGAFTLSASGCIYGAGVAALLYTVEAGVLGPHPGLEADHGVKIIFLFAVAALAVLVVKKLERKTREVELLGEMLRERAETAEASLSTFLDTVASGLLVLDEQGRVLSVNEPLARMLGTEARELSAGGGGGAGFTQLKTRLMATLAGGRATESFEFSAPDGPGESRVPAAGGHAGKLEVQARVFRLGGRRCVMGVASENGRDEPGAAGGSQHSNDDKPADFTHAADLGGSVSVVAHEVKNSMTCVLGLLSLLRDDISQDARSLGLLRKAVGAVEELNAFVSDLLLYSRRVTPRFERVDLVSVVDRALGHVEEKVPGAKNARFTRQFSVERLDADADQRQIQRVVMNLLLNAYQAVSGDGNVWVRVGAEDGWAVIEVRDDGCGMPAESVERVFEPFFTTKASGSGLGLPIARNLVLAHDGTLDVKSSQGSGTDVKIRIPIDRCGSRSVLDRGSNEGSKRGSGDGSAGEPHGESDRARSELQPHGGGL